VQAWNWILPSTLISANWCGVITWSPAASCSGSWCGFPRVDIDEIRALVNQAGAAGNSGGFHICRPASSAPREFDEQLTEAELHYEFVPGLSHTEADGQFDWGWRLSASDDVGSEYADRDSGAFDGRAGLAAAHGSRDLGGQIQPEASLLTLQF